MRRRRRTAVSAPRVLGLITGLVMAVALAGCTSVEGTDGKEYVAGQFQAAEIAPADRGAPVQSAGQTVDGDSLDVADYRGQVLVVNVWWSGCGPCVKELPLLVDAAASLGDEVSLIGLNIRDSSAADAASFERGLGVDFPSLYSPGGQNLLDFGDQVSARIIPSTVVLDRAGRVAALLSGAIPTQQTLESVVQTVVDEDSGAAAPTDASGVGDG